MESLNEIFELFSNERRRFALYYLDQADGAVPLEELAEQVYEWEADPVDDVPNGKYEEMLISLEHHHLPQIEDATHIEYEREKDQLRISGISSELDVLLSVTKAIEQPSVSRDITFGEGR